MTFTKSNENIDVSDIEFAILTMPCKCPLVCRCCPKIVNNDISYVVVFQSDIDAMKRQGISKITDIPDAYNRINFDLLFSETFMMKDQNFDSSFEQQFIELFKTKYDIWNYVSKEIAIPLINIFKNSSSSYSQSTSLRT